MKRCFPDGVIFILYVNFPPVPRIPPIVNQPIMRMDRHARALLFRRLNQLINKNYGLLFDLCPVIYWKEVYHRSGVPLEQADSMGEIGQMEDLLERLIRRERNERLYDAISRLTPTQQRRVMMFMDDMSYVEIARREGTKFAPVYRSLQAAFRKLRDLMAEYEDEVRRGIVE